MMRNRYGLVAALAALVLSSVAAAQEFPGKRVRPPHLAENWVGSPEAYLTEARVVVRDFSVDTSSGGMRINGRIWSDFDVEGGRGAPSGQLMELEVEVSLHEQQSDLDDKLGPQVANQMTKIKVNSTENVGDVALGTASFSLPEMSKPLPPGIYRLVARAYLARQTQKIKDALMWVPDIYGTYYEYDADGKPIEPGVRVYLSKHHKNAWRDMVESEVCQSVGTMFLGNPYRGSTLYVGADNCLCRDPSFGVFEEVERLMDQRKKTDELYEQQKKDKDLDQRKVKASYEQSIKQVDMLITRAGGKLESKEATWLQKTRATMKNIREAIVRFEDDLTLKYWIAFDSLHYQFHTVNTLGYNCYVAIDKGDNMLDRREREAKQDKLKDPEEKRRAEEARAKAFQYIPEPIKKAADELRQISQENGTLDSVNFTRKQGKEVTLDSAKWSAWRVKFLGNFRNKIDPLIKAVDLSSNFSIQKWSRAFTLLTEARDAVIMHTYSYEWYLRMMPVEKQVGATGDKKLREDADKAILEDWKTEAGENLKQLEPLFTNARGMPASISSRFDTACKQAKAEKMLDIADYAYRYKQSVDKQPVPPPRRYKAEK